MKFWMHGLFGAALAGGIWAGLWQIVMTMALIVTTGAGLTLQAGPAMLAGLVAGVVAILYRPRGTLLRHGAGLLVMTVLLWGFTLGTPFDPTGLLPAWQNVTALILAAALSWFSLSSAIGAMPPAPQARYAAEVFYLRLLWGLGLMMFVLIVAIPFYVMVMTSLKSQQSLLANPLDFSIDPGVGAAVLFRSYIELFTDYDFGTLLLNSAIVSVVTVLITLLFSVPGASIRRQQFRWRCTCFAAISPACRQSLTMPGLWTGCHAFRSSRGLRCRCRHRRSPRSRSMCS